MGRAPCCDKANVKRGPWSPEEDSRLRSYIEQHGFGGNWIALPQKIGLKRCGKSCRLRWLNYLRPNIKHGEFSEEEDNIICSMYITIGSRWSIIAGQLPGRTDNDIKNYWNTKLKKKLLGSKQQKNQNQTPTTTRRAGILLKQEDIGEENQIINSSGQPNAYSWPEPSGHPTYVIHQDENLSTRKLLMKIGGSLSTEPSFIVPPPPPPLAQASNEANSENVTFELDHRSVHANNSMVSSESFPCPSGFNNNIPTELNDLFSFNYNCNSVEFEGLDCFYNSMVDETNGALDNTSFKANYWSEVSPTINYQQMIMPSYQPIQACSFEDILD